MIQSLVPLVILALVGSSLQTPSATNVTAACNTYVVSGVPGGFTQRVFADFSGATSGGDVGALLRYATESYYSMYHVDDGYDFARSYGLGVSNYQINSSPVARAFTPSNIALGNGALNLKVSAYSGSGAIQSAEMSTQDQFKYASVRTVQKSSTSHGVVEGNFFYRKFISSGVLVGR